MNTTEVLIVFFVLMVLAFLLGLYLAKKWEDRP